MHAKLDSKQLLMAAFPILMIFLAILGGFRWYSSVPYWDTWISNVGFLTKVNEGDLYAWWQQHFEHRVLITKTLAWFNYKLFNGFNWFLVVINYILLAAVVLIVLKIKRDYLSKSKVSYQDQFFLACFLVAWLFQWMQSQSLLWDVCSQIWLAQLFPLCALYYLHRAVSSALSRHLFYIAVAFGVASILTMANGLLTLPMMILYCVLMHQNYRRILFLTSLFVVTTLIYFYGYESPKNHSSALHSLIENPLGVAQYALYYIGGPFYHLLGDSRVGKVAALVAGILALILTLFLALKLTHPVQKNTLLTAIVLYLAYFFASALGIAGGRLVFGVDHALWTGRYSTSSLIAWSLLFIVYYEQAWGFLNRSLLNKHKIKVSLLFALIALLMLFQQLKVFKSPKKELFDQKIAVLSAVVGVNDSIALAPIYNDTGILQPIIDKAYHQKISIFGTFPFSEIKKNMGTSIEDLPPSICEGALDKWERVEEDARFLRIYGWMLNEDKKSYPQLVKFVRNKQIVGYALTGLQMKAVPESYVGKMSYSGFKGYILLSANAGIDDVQVLSSNCKLAARIN